MKRIAPESQIIDITHGIPPQARAPGRARAREHGPVHAARASTSPSSTRAWAASRRPLALRGRDRAALRRARQRPAHPRGRARTAASRQAHELANPGLRAPVRLAHVPRPRPLRAGRRAPRARRRARRARAAGRSGRARPARPAAAGRSADRACARPSSTSTGSGTSSSTSRASTSSRSASCRARASSSSSGTERYYAVAARTFGDARPGDILLYEDAYRNISLAINRGQRRRDVRRRAGQELRINVDVP